MTIRIAESDLKLIIDLLDMQVAQGGTDAHSAAECEGLEKYLIKVAKFEGVEVTK